jgi:hypothetical protein
VVTDNGAFQDRERENRKVNKKLFKGFIELAFSKHVIQLGRRLLSLSLGLSHASEAG